VESIAGYHLKTALGTGGMANVYLAIQDSLDRQVAIKILDASLIDDAQIQAQFAQESKLIASLNHPNIVQVIDQGMSAQGHPYFVMPYIKSISLNAILKRNDVSITRKMDIAIQICKALAYAHRNGVVHRDIKPSNILVDYDGHVRLVDFGIAGYFTPQKNPAHHDENLVMGTDAYMAPEQAESVSYATHLSDLYSMGVVMHQLFFGALPFQIIASASPITNELTETLKTLVNKCLEPTPINRPTSADEIRQHLLLIAQGKHLRNNRWSNDSTQDDIPANYKLLDVLKEDPFGATYLVKDPKHKRFLIIKKQRVEHLGNAKKVNAKLTHVQHPHIARIFGTGQNQRVFITVSEYLAAGSLQERLTQAFTLGQWILMAQQLCAALSSAHSNSIVHGNLRPSNILFAENNFIKITDFGFPAHTYSAFDDWYRPKNEVNSISADIYSAGAILFQLLSGKRLQNSFFNWKNHWALRHIPRKLRKILISMTQNKPANRYTNAEQAMQALHEFYDQQDTQIARKVLLPRQ